MATYQKSRSKSKNPSVALLALLLIIAGGWGVSEATTDGEDDQSPPMDEDGSDGGGGGLPPADSCSDGNDNDGDGFTDLEDEECNPESPLYDGTENGDDM